MLLQGQPLLRVVIALSAAATLLYTPLLKRLTGIKNATVAAVITASPLAGALAAGAVSDCNTTVVVFWSAMLALHGNRALTCAVDCIAGAGGHHAACASVHLPVHGADVP